MTATTNTNPATPRNTAKQTLTANWTDLVKGGDWSAEEMWYSLTEQAEGACDMSLEELTPDLAALLGWDIDALTEEQEGEWSDLVTEAAIEWLEGAERPTLD